MLSFIGNIDAKLDAKGRVFVPSVYRKQLSEKFGSLSLVLRKDPDNLCLVIYPEKVWEKKVESLKAEINEWNAADQMLLMQFVSEAESLDMDSQGRVLLQKRYLNQIEVCGDVVFVGGLDRFYVWSREVYEAKKLSSFDFAKRLQEKMSKKVLDLNE